MLKVLRSSAQTALFNCSVCCSTQLLRLLLNSTAPFKCCCIHTTVPFSAQCNCSVCCSVQLFRSTSLLDCSARWLITNAMPSSVRLLELFCCKLMGTCKGEYVRAFCVCNYARGSSDRVIGHTVADATLCRPQRWLY